MRKKERYIICIFLIIGIISFISASESSNYFKVDNVLLKLIVKQGDTLSKTIKITNLNNFGDFEIKENFEFMSIDKDSFSLENGEENFLEIIFDTNLEGGVYIGNIKIVNNGEELIIPVILEIESKEVLFDSLINIPLDYLEVNPGGNLVVENKIFNLENIGLTIVDVSYKVLDLYGNTIFMEKENMAVENQLLTTKVISIPRETVNGDYVLGVTVEYLGLTGTSSYFFKIIDEVVGEIKTERSNDYFWYFIVFVFFTFVMMFLFIQQRDKLVVKLQNQHKNQLRQYMGQLSEREKKKLKSVKRVVERHKIKREFNLIRKLTKRKIKSKHKAQKTMFFKLKKKKRKTEMQKKLGEWKKQGVNISEFLAKSDKVGGKGLEKKVGKYKKQGFRV